MRFTTNWADANLSNWSRWLDHLKGEAGVTGLEIGVYEGKSTKWWCENILTGPGSMLFAVDIDISKCRSNIDELREGGHSVFLAEGDASALEPMSLEFDFIYIDGPKEASDINRVAASVWSHLKIGGVMIFDDYEWEWWEGSLVTKPKAPPKTGIDGFIMANSASIEIISKGAQVAIKKK